MLDLATRTVTEDWPERVPETAAKVDVFEARIGDIQDELFGRSKRSTSRMGSHGKESGLTAIKH
jgi:hypothetical protein